MQGACTPVSLSLHHAVRSMCMPRYISSLVSFYRQVQSVGDFLALFNTVKLTSWGHEHENQLLAKMAMQYRTVYIIFTVPDCIDYYVFLS